MRQRRNLYRAGANTYRLVFPDKGTITVTAKTESQAVKEINRILKNKNMFIRKRKSNYWTFPNGEPAPNNYLWDGHGWRKR